MIEYISWVFSLIYSINAGLSLYRLGDVISHSAYIKILFPWSHIDIVIMILSIIGSTCLGLGYFTSMINPIKLELTTTCIDGSSFELTVIKITNIIGSIVHLNPSIPPIY